MNINDVEDFRLSDAVEFHQTLNTILFDDDNYLRNNVRNKLLKIAKDFIEFLNIDDLDVKDIVVTGSNAAYSYTKHSDIDLHLIVDLSKINNDEIYLELFNAKKYIYNNDHNIKIFNFDVELYVESLTTPAKSLGEYSVLRDRWIKFPVKKIANLNEKATKAKFEKLSILIDKALKSDDYIFVKNVLKTIKKYRSVGLEKQGEFSPENLAFKALRSKNLIDDLYTHLNDLHSKNLSLIENSNLYKFLRPNELRGSYSDLQMKQFGFRKSNNGFWFIEKHKWEKLINSGKLREDSKLLNKDTPSIAELIKKFKLSRDFLLTQLKHGIKVELEHTKNSDIAKEIALDHLGEDPHYYEKLADLNLEESASGYIPSNAQKNDPRFKTALTVDIKPDTIQKNAKSLGFKVSRSGIPPLLRK